HTSCRLSADLSFPVLSQRPLSWQLPLILRPKTTIKKTLRVLCVLPLCLCVWLFLQHKGPISSPQIPRRPIFSRCLRDSPTVRARRSPASTRRPPRRRTHLPLGRTRS